jgi:hypothetical protein
MKSRDFLIGALVGGVLVILIIDHGNGTLSAGHPRASVSASARAARSEHPSAARRSRHSRRRTPAAAHPRAHGASARPARSPQVTRPVAASHAASGGGWPVGIASVVAIVFAAAAVAITFRAGRAGTTGRTG